MTARVQNNGLANITAAWVAYASVPKYLQWGTGSGAAASANAVNNTAGTTEARTSGTPAQATTTVTNDNMTVTGTITAIGTPTITEVGLFDAAGTGSPPTGGNMCVYADHTGVGLLAGDSIAYTVKVTFS